LIKTSVLHCQGEVCTGCLLVPDFVWVARCRSIFFLSVLQRLLNIGRLFADPSDLWLRRRCLCLPHDVWRHALGGTHPSVVQLKIMRLRGRSGGYPGRAPSLTGPPVALFDEAGGHGQSPLIPWRIAPRYRDMSDEKACRFKAPLQVRY